MTDEPLERQPRRRRRSLRIMLFVLVPLLVLSAVSTGLSIFIRRADVDAERWHVDPTTAAPTGNPNWFRVTPDSAPADRHPERDASAPVFDVAVPELAEAFDSVVLAEDRVEVVAGSAAEGFVTYVQRSTFFAFPDFVSVTFTDVTDGGSSFAVFSRSQYGKSDLGVNEKRVRRWVAATQAELG